MCKNIVCELGLKLNLAFKLKLQVGNNYSIPLIINYIPRVGFVVGSQAFRIYLTRGRI